MICAMYTPFLELQSIRKVLRKLATTSFTNMNVVTRIRYADINPVRASRDAAIVSLSRSGFRSVLGP